MYNNFKRLNSHIYSSPNVGKAFVASPHGEASLPHYSRLKGGGFVAGITKKYDFDIAVLNRRDTADSDLVLERRA